MKELEEINEQIEDLERNFPEDEKGVDENGGDVEIKRGKCKRYIDFCISISVFINNNLKKNEESLKFL